MRLQKRYSYCALGLALLAYGLTLIAPAPMSPFFIEVNERRIRVLPVLDSAYLRTRTAKNRHCPVAVMPPGGAQQVIVAGPKGLDSLVKLESHGTLQPSTFAITSKLIGPNEAYATALSWKLPPGALVRLRIAPLHKQQKLEIVFLGVDGASWSTHLLIQPTRNELRFLKRELPKGTSLTQTTLVSRGAPASLDFFKALSYFALPLFWGAVAFALVLASLILANWRLANQTTTFMASQHLLLAIPLLIVLTSPSPLLVSLVICAILTCRMCINRKLPALAAAAAPLTCALFYLAPLQAILLWPCCCTYLFGWPKHGHRAIRLAALFLAASLVALTPLTLSNTLRAPIQQTIADYGLASETTPDAPWGERGFNIPRAMVNCANALQALVHHNLVLALIPCALWALLFAAIAAKRTTGLLMLAPCILALLAPFGLRSAHLESLACLQGIAALGLVWGLSVLWADLSSRNTDRSPQ